MIIHTDRPLRSGGLFGKPVPRAVCVAATFAASGALHCYPLLIVGAPANDIISVMTYFAVHCILVLVEPFIFGGTIAGGGHGRGSQSGGSGNGRKSAGNREVGERYDNSGGGRGGASTGIGGNGSSSSFGRWFVLLAHLATISLIVRPFQSLTT